MKRMGMVDAMDRRFDRIWRGTLVAFVALALTLFPVRTPVADASEDWCADDPILTFSNGTRLQVLAAYPSTYQPTVSGPVQWDIQVPVNIGRVTVTLPSTAAHSELVTLNYTGGKWGGGMQDIQIHGTVTVSAPAKFGLVLAVYGDTSTKPKNGESNKALTIAAHTHSGDFSAFLGTTTGTSYVFTQTGTILLENR